VIEQIDEPREGKEFGEGGTLFDMSGKQITGWTNKLIWGDNKLILSSLKNGPMRKEIEAQGGLKLIYIDPPFDVGADFSMDIEIGEEDESENFTKNPSVIEEIAYRDTWGKGADSFIAMLYERLKLMHELLAEDGSIYVHCDWRVNGVIKLALDEIFGKNRQKREIIWSKETYLDLLRLSIKIIFTLMIQFCSILNPIIQSLINNMSPIRMSILKKDLRKMTMMEGDCIESREKIKSNI
jgi:hypothetical protein